jgi:hypothetical protein
VVPLFTEIYVYYLPLYLCLCFHFPFRFPISDITLEFVTGTYEHFVFCDVLILKQLCLTVEWLKMNEVYICVFSAELGSKVRKYTVFVTKSI